MTIFACPFRVCGDETLCDNGKPMRRSGTLADYECMAWKNFRCRLVVPVDVC